LKKEEEVDEDDLDQIQDDDLRDYRYKNMLEDLKQAPRGAQHPLQGVSDFWRLSDGHV